MKNFVKASLALAAFAGLSAVASAQTLIVGSSAFYTQAGLGAAASTANGGLGSTCIWNFGSNAVAVQDTTTGSAITDSGSVWIAWAPGSDCSTTSSNSSIYLYLNTDSVVGNRALFNGDTLIAGSAGAPTGLSGLGTIAPAGSTPVTGNLPSAIWSVISGATVNTAATDIRPEDAEFAITRATTACGTAINQYTGAGGTATGSASQYLGLGYNNGDNIHSYFSSSAFHVIKFTLPSSPSVYPIGATPIVVAVNGTGWNGATNLNRSTLALFLDGSIGNTKDAGATGTGRAATVIVREPLSGTYNTMEYNIPNSVELQTSQDVGLYQPTAAQNCPGTSNPNWNTQGFAMPSLAGTKVRAIGTGQELSEVFSTTNSLGYAFWSAANFSGAGSGSSPKYLTIDGVDPLYDPSASTYSTDKSQIPTSSNGLLGDVTLTNVQNGTYPIWSLLRLVSSSASSAVSSLATAAGSFVTSSLPDFVPFSGSTYTPIGNLTVEHAHFTPPGIYASGSAPVPQNYAGGSGTEVGGDVGGVVIPYKVDQDFLTDTGATFSGTQAPSTLRRN